MPVPLLRAYGAMLDRLEAGESLLAVTRAALGAGTADKSQAAEVRHAWARMVAGPRRRALRPQTREGHRSLATAAGIGIRLVPRKA